MIFSLSLFFGFFNVLIIQVVTTYSNFYDKEVKSLHNEMTLDLFNPVPIIQHCRISFSVTMENNAIELKRRQAKLKRNGTHDLYNFISLWSPHIYILSCRESENCRKWILKTYIFYFSWATSTLLCLSYRRQISCYSSPFSFLSSIVSIIL